MTTHNSERKIRGWYHEDKVTEKFKLIEPLDERLIRTLKIDPSTPKGRIIILIKEHLCRRSTRCSLCKQKFNRRSLIIDRRKPTSHGGKDNIENLQLLCQKCSALKGGNTMLQTRKKIRTRKRQG